MAFPSWKLIDENSYRQDFYLFGSRWLNGYGKMKINHRSFNLSRKSPAAKLQRRTRWVGGLAAVRWGQAPSDKLRQQHREMRKKHSGGCASPFPGIPNFLWPKQADAFLPFPGQGQGGQGGWFQGWRKEAIRSRHRLGGSRSRFPADGPSGSGHIKGQ